jgi:hypothetical protein
MSDPGFLHLHSANFLFAIASLVVCGCLVGYIHNFWSVAILRANQDNAFFWRTLIWSVPAVRSRTALAWTKLTHWFIFSGCRLERTFGSAVGARYKPVFSPLRRPRSPIFCHR